MIRNYEPSDAAGLLALWNSAGTAMGYAPLDEAGLAKYLTGHPDFSPKYSFVLERRGKVLGFINGTTGNHIPKGDVRGYCTCLILGQDADDPENTRAMLETLEDAFRAAGRKFCAVTFFNPIRLPWILPGTPGHQHNNMPGVPTDLPLYTRMIHEGYICGATEQAMYLNLAEFQMPQAILERREKMAGEGYTVAQYDPKHHAGLGEMLEALGNPMWISEISQAGESGMNLLVGLHGNRVAGFTGPIYPEETGRGYFAGIGVAPEFEHHGLGTLLFYSLLEKEKEAGAAYMSLFTGTENPARYIYEGAGFRVVRKFGVMLKEL